LKHRFSALDGFRGVCALTVLLFHFLPNTPVGFRHGYLSVDVFFVLSGFVLAFAFGDKLDAGMSLSTFVGARVRRLGPVLLLGSFLSGAAAFFVAGHLSVVLVVDILRSVLLIPVTRPGITEAFPLNGAFWSLFAEFWVNVAFGAVAARLKPASLTACIVAAYVVLITISVRAGTVTFGTTPSSIYYSIFRAAPSFLMGVLIFKLWRSGYLSRLPSMSPVLVFAIWLAVVVIPPLPVANLFYDLVQVIIVAPILIALLARSEGATPPWALWLGRVSYPLYATHIAVHALGMHLFSHNGQIAVVARLSLIAASLVLAEVVARWYEPAMFELLAYHRPAHARSDVRGRVREQL